MYYQPELIPENYRQPYSTRGIRQGQSELSDASPHFSNLNNAVREGGPRNGVLTAIEDFRQQSKERYFFLTCNVEYGLDVLVHRDGNRGPFDVLKWRLRFLRFETAARLSRLRWRIEEAIEHALPGPYRWLTSVKRLVPPGRATR